VQAQLSMAMMELDEWVSDNPNATGKEIKAYAKTLLTNQSADMVKRNLLDFKAVQINDTPVFIPLTNPEVHQKYHISDTALATMQYMIEAHSLGLGTCWAGVIGSSIEQEIKELLGVPDHLNILGLIATGYANEEPTKGRKNLEDLIHYERY